MLMRTDEARPPLLSILEDLDALRSLAPQWSELLAHDPDASTFVSPAWILSWWEGYRPDARLCAIAAHEGSRLAGLAPLMRRRETRVGVAMHHLRFIGDGTFEADHLIFPVAGPGAAATLHALLDATLRLPWDVAVLSNVPESSGLAATLPAWAAHHRLLLDAVRAPCPARALPDSFDALLASLPSRFRTAVRSTRRKLAAAHTVEFGLHQDPDGFDAALHTLFENHESRWRAKQQSGVFVDPRRREFYRRLTRALHAAGALRFFYLKLDGRIVAQEYCFAHGRTVYLLQEGFDYALARENVGNALRSHVFEHLIEQRYATYDFLAGVSRHKQNWSDAAPCDVTFVLCRPTLKGRIAHYGPRLAEAIKRPLRPLRDRLRGRPAGKAEAASEGATA
jgi:CelD/BcsL family acetyltransferase involved in cellulose biosynthesis